MIGIEFMRDGRPATDVAQSIQRRCVDHDLLILTCGIDDNVIRLLPPLTIDEAELERGLDILEQSLREELAQ
jgi:4-aminobutyrate aminotransferase-like enzyme